MKNRERIWVLVANRGAAKVFERTGPAPSGLQLVQVVEHPAGRLGCRDFNADKSGRSFQRRGVGSSSLDKSQDPVEHETERFAHVLAEILAEGAEGRDGFDRLVLIAAPRLLGVLRKVINKPVRDRVVATIAKDIVELRDLELRAEVERACGEGERQSVAS